jgi:hypothetical protein
MVDLKRNTTDKTGKQGRVTEIRTGHGVTD